MRSDFEPTHLKKANEIIDKHLKAVKLHVDTNKEYKKDILKRPTIWEKFRDIVKR